MSEMDLLRGILKAAVEAGASDVHIKVGGPVILRISRNLVAVDCAQPTEDWMKKVTLKPMSKPNDCRRLRR